MDIIWINKYRQKYLKLYTTRKIKHNYYIIFMSNKQNYLFSSLIF